MIRREISGGRMNCKFRTANRSVAESLVRLEYHSGRETDLKQIASRKGRQGEDSDSFTMTS